MKNLWLWCSYAFLTALELLMKHVCWCFIASFFQLSLSLDWFVTPLAHPINLFARLYYWNMETVWDKARKNKEKCSTCKHFPKIFRLDALTILILSCDFFHHVNIKIFFFFEKKESNNPDLPSTKAWICRLNRVVAFRK